MAWLLRPGTDLVLQVHVRPHGRAQPITPQIGLSFAAGAPVRHPAVLMLGSRDIDIPAGAPEYVVQDTFELPVDVQVLAVYPHAHYLGRALEGFARLPNGRTRWLVRIRDWDFNWQDEYRYAEPVFLPGGSTVTMRWRYDNSAANPRNPSRPPRRVEYGPRSSDEMADLVLQVLPQAEADRETLERDLRWKYLADAADWAARSAYRRGAELREAGRHAEAAEQFRQALSHRPAPGYHAALAEALASLGQRNAAALHLQEALRLAESQGNQALAAEMRRRLGRLR
jgi:tetratricopeptide (TPR) repeat protein